MRPSFRTIGFSALLLLGVSACASAPLDVARVDTTCPDRCGSIGPSSAEPNLTSQNRRWVSPGAPRQFRPLGNKQAQRNAAIDRALSGRAPGY